MKRQELKQTFIDLLKEQYNIKYINNNKHIDKIFDNWYKDYLLENGTHISPSDLALFFKNLKNKYK